MERNDENLLARLMRRVESARGVVFLEFALIAPLALSLVLFAADFCRILQAEQQLEIAARVMADVESHYAQAKDDQSPFKGTKTCVASYLKNTLGLDDITAVMSQIEVKPVPSVLSPFREVFELFSVSSGDSWIVKVIKAIFRNVVNIALGGTQHYVADLCTKDRTVGATCALRVKTLFPSAAYAFFNSFKYKNFVYVAMTEYERGSNSKIDFTRRRKYHCTMPLMETLESPPQTWIRKAERNLSKSFVITILKKLGLKMTDYKKAVFE